MIMELQKGQGGGNKQSSKQQFKIDIKIRQVCQMIKKKQTPFLIFRQISPMCLTIEFLQTTEHQPDFKMFVQLTESQNKIRINCQCKITKKLKEEIYCMPKLLANFNNYYSFFNGNYYYNHLSNSINISSFLNLQPFAQTSQLASTIQKIIFQSNNLLKRYMEILKQKRSRNKRLFLKLNQMKNQFQVSRLQRAKATKICLLQNNKNIGQNLSRVVNDFNQEIKKASPLSRKLRLFYKNYVSNSEKKIQLNIVNIKPAKVQKQNEPTNTILKGILLQHQEQYESQQMGGNGCIVKCKCNFELILTVRTTVHNQLELYSNKNNLKTNRILMVQNLAKKKPFLGSLPSVQSFKNELYCLLMLKQKKCEQIAQYFRVVKVDFKNQQNFQKQDFMDSKNIYSKYYEKKFNDFMNKSSQIKIKLAIDLIQGINFLFSNSILHRDIKPSNIMVDEKMRIKIIDFGSACYAFDYQLKNLPYMTGDARSFTRDYSLQYHIAQYYNDSIGPFEFIKHRFFDLYSFGKILQNFYLDMSQDFPFYLENIQYLSKKCMEYNPEDRLAPEQVKRFLNLLLKILNQITQI